MTPRCCSFKRPSFDIFETTAKSILDLGQTCVVKMPAALCPEEEGRMPPELEGRMEESRMLD